MSSIYSKTLYQKRFMMLGWFVAITALIAFTLAFFNSFSNGAIGQSLQNLPPGVQKVVGDVASFTSIGGYIAQQLFVLRVPVLLIILSIAVMVSVSGGEEQQGILETQLSLPVSRPQLLLQKLAAALTVIIAGGLAVLAGVALGLVFAGQHYNLAHVLPLLFSVLPVALNYGLVGFMVASVTGRRGLALGAASGLAFAGYVVNTMAASVGSLQTADKFTLFHYYATSTQLNWGNLAVQLSVAAVLLAASLAGFAHRDIRARS